MGPPTALGLAICLALVLAAQGAIRSPSHSTPSLATAASIQDRYIVKYKSEDKPRLVNAQAGTNITATVQTLALDEEVEYAEKVHPVFALDITPNDPSYSKQYHLAKIGAPTAWTIGTGNRNVSVCVIDTGVDYTHPDLRANLVFNKTGRVVGYNVLAGYNSWDPFDDNQHGTHCAGILGAVGNNAVGIAGVNWQITILPCKFMAADGSGDTYGAVLCVDWCKQQGANVMSASFGSYSPSQALHDAIANSGALFVAAAGNDGENLAVKPVYPAAFNLPNQLTVAATGASDELAFFSNYDSVVVHLAAPGVAIYSTIPQNKGNGSGYYSMSGTSMATPVVAGAAALALAAGQAESITPQTLRAYILNSVDPVASLQGKVYTQGRLNVSRLVSSISKDYPAPPAPPASPPPPSPPSSLPSSPAPSSASPSPSPQVDKPSPPSPRSPSPSPSPRPTPSPQQPTCRGVAYDGYLGACMVTLDVPLNPSSVAVTKEDGSFSLLALTQPKAAYILPYIDTTGSSPADQANTVPQSVPTYCHDSVTLLPEYLPLAAPTAGCASAIVISPASSLLVHGMGVLTEVQLKRQLSIPATLTVGQYDAFKGALQGDRDAVTMLAAELALKSTVLSIVRLITKAPTAAPQVARIVFKSIAETIAAWDTATGWWLQGYSSAAASATNLSNAQHLATILAAAQADVAASGQFSSQDLLPSLSNEQSQAAMAAVGSMNALFSSSVDAAFLQRAMQVASTSLLAKLVQLASGGLSVEAFANATSPAALGSAVRSAVLAGALPDLGQAGASSSDKSSTTIIVAAVAGAVGGAVLAIGLLWAYRRWRFWRPASQPTAAPPIVLADIVVGVERSSLAKAGQGRASAAGADPGRSSAAGATAAAGVSASWQYSAGRNGPCLARTGVVDFVGQHMPKH